MKKNNKKRKKNKRSKSVKNWVPGNQSEAPMTAVARIAEDATPYIHQVATWFTRSQSPQLKRATRNATLKPQY